MDLSSVQLGELVTISIIAIALGMDAFSLCVGMGMAGIRLRNVVKVSTVIGIFHVLMPLIGMFLGILLSGMMGDIATYVGGLILSILGVQMIWNAVTDNKRKKEKRPFIYSTYLGLLLFSLSVSIDAFTVGFSFAIFHVNTLVAITLFGIAGAVMSAFGLLIGRKLGSWMGSYGNMVSGVILLLFGIKFLM